MDKCKLGIRFQSRVYLCRFVRQLFDDNFCSRECRYGREDDDNVDDDTDVAHDGDEVDIDDDIDDDCDGVMVMIMKV